MLSRSTEKLWRKLSTKKYRLQHRMFIAEGKKVVQELMDAGLTVEHLLVREGSSLFPEHSTAIPEKQLEQLSQLHTADEVMAIFRFPEIEVKLNGLVLILDRVNDPGNLGTIIRTCDWFGIHNIFCTIGTVDVYNAKTVQSTMGSMARVAVHYASQEAVFEELSAKGYNFWCADMEGENIAEAQLPEKLALVMGSESHGPSAFWKQNSHPITIPRKENSKTESLNVAIATAIILGNISLSR